MKNEKEIIFTDFWTKKVYQVPSSLHQSWPIYQFRFILSVVTSIILWQFNVNVLLCCIVGLTFILIAEFRFRTFFIKRCIPLEQKEEVKKISTSAFVLNAFLYTLFGILLFFYGLFNNNIQNPVIVYVVGALSLGVAILYAFKGIQSRK